MTHNKTKYALICLCIISLCSTAFCGKIIYPFNATTAIVKAGETFDIWFDADTGQTVKSVELRSPYLIINRPMDSAITAGREYDTISGNTCNWLITVTVPVDTPADRYDLVLKTSTGDDISSRAVKVIREYKTEYSIFHISDTHMCQGAKINGHPERLLKVSALADLANIIGPEIVFITGDLINDTNGRFPDAQKRADFFYNGSPANGVKGVQGFNAATFSAAGNHDFLEKSQPFKGEPKVKSKFWNKYHGLQYHHFKYGNTRLMTVNTGWVGLDWGYQLKDHASWLADVGSGNLRIAAYHKSEMGVMGAFANKVDLGLTVIGHNHHLADKNPYALGGKKIQYYADSVREHLCFNLFRIKADGSYTAVNNQEFVENPADAPSLWRPKLTLTYAKANDGTSKANTATLVNKFGIAFPRARVRFIMPKGASYTVSKGTIEQQFDGDSVRVVDVCVAIKANSKTTIKIN